MNTKAWEILDKYADEDFIEIAELASDNLSELLASLPGNMNYEESAEITEALDNYTITDDDISRIHWALEAKDPSPRIIDHATADRTFAFKLRMCSHYLIECPENIVCVYFDRSQLFLPEIRYTLLRAKQLGLKCEIVTNDESRPFPVRQIGIELMLNENKVRADRPHILLVDVKHPFNLGTTIRTAKAFGIEDFAVIDKDKRIYLPATLGSARININSFNIEHFDSIEDYAAAFPNHNIHLFMPGGTESLEEAVQSNTSPLYTLAFGNESSGIPKEYAQYGKTVYIPMKGDVDSLNVCIAATVALYAFTS